MYPSIIKVVYARGDHEWMGQTMIDPKTLNALGYLVAAIRDQTAVDYGCKRWDRPGIDAALRSAAEQHTLGQVARAAVDAALTPSTTTPAGIGSRARDGWGGSDTVDPPTPTPTNTRGLRCKRCGRWVTEPDHDCTRQADPDTARRLAAAAKAEIRRP